MALIATQLRAAPTARRRLSQRSLRELTFGGLILVYGLLTVGVRRRG